MTDAARSHRSSFIVHRSVFNVVVHTPDVVGDRMAGPGIRAWHLAAELAKHVPTRLIARKEGSAPADVTLIEHGSAEAREALREAAVLVGLR